MDFVKNELILWYLNYDDIKITEKEIYNNSQKYNIPIQIFLKKLIERLVTEHNSNKDEIIKILQEQMNLNIPAEGITYITNLIDLIEPIEIKDRNTLTENKFKNLMSSFNNLTSLSMQNCKHKEQPLPDPIKGRPYIDWKECYHEGCHKKFTYDHQLVEHLNQVGAYTQGYHKIHQEYIWYHKFTPEKVLLKNITKCPVWICNKNLNGTQQVIEHFQRLGLEPFWEEGMDFSTKTQTEYLFNKDLKIYNIENCIVCLDNKPNLILDKCMHCCYCIDCFLSSTNATWIKKCPVCNTFYDKVYPY